MKPNFSVVREENLLCKQVHLATSISALYALEHSSSRRNIQDKHQGKAELPVSISKRTLETGP